jgi:hypothetical protein
LPGEIGNFKRVIGGVLDMRQRNDDAEGRAPIRCTFNIDRAAHALDDAFGNRQSETNAVEFSRQSTVDLLEFMKDAAAIAGRNADAGVAHGDG